MEIAKFDFRGYIRRENLLHLPDYSFRVFVTTLFVHINYQKYFPA